MSEWLISMTELPNLHPAVVHLPLGLLPVAVLVDAGSLLLRNQQWLRRSAILLYVLGALGAWLAVLAGEQAADSLVAVPARLQPVIATHSDWGHYAADTFALVAAASLAVTFWAHKSQGSGSAKVVAARAVVLLAALAGLGVLARAADMGGGLVYRQGLAVAIESEPGAGHDAHGTTGMAEKSEPSQPPASRLTRTDDGTLTWHPLAADGEALGTLLRAAEGSSLEAVIAKSSRAPDGESQEGLVLQVEGRALLVLEPTFGDLQLDVELERSEFRGTLALTHHVSDVANFESFAVDAAGSIALAQTIDGREKELDRESLDLPPAEGVYSVSVSKGHLKGMIDGATVVHGHARSLPDGRVGIVVDGEGAVRIRSFTVTPLGESAGKPNLDPQT